jgi:uncharacterized protein
MRNASHALAVLLMAVCTSSRADEKAIVSVGTSPAEINKLLTSTAASKETTAIRTTTTVPVFNSTDKKMESGLFESTAGYADYDSFPANEFIYIIDGSATITSANGSVVKVKKGDALIIPKGWKGKWTTPGYKKLYVDYAGD